MHARNVSNADPTGRARRILRALPPTLLVVALSCFLVVGMAAAAEAQRGRGRGNWGGPTGPMRGLGFEVLSMAEELELTEQQITRLKDIRKSAPSKIMPKTQALMEARIEYRDLMADANADTKAIRAAHKRVVDAQSQLKSATFDLRLEVRDVLTAAQRAELKQNIGKRLRERVHRPRRLHREHLQRHGGLGGHFEGLTEHFGAFDEPFGNLDEDAAFFGLAPSDPNWGGEERFWIEEDLEAVEEGERL